MNRDEPLSIPSAIAFLAFSAGLLTRPWLVSPSAAAGGVAAVGILLLVMGRDKPRGLVLPLLILAGGIAIGDQHHRRTVAQHAAVAALPRDRFVTLRARISHDWKRTDADQTAMLRLRTFQIEAGRQSIRLDSPVRIYASRPPSIDGWSSSIEAEGMIRSSESGEFIFIVKSPRLIRYRGRLSRWSPRRWNRAATLALDRIARNDPALARPAALVEALALGRGEKLPDELREDYRRGGIYHVLVFSGLQIAFAAAVVSLLVRVAGGVRTADAVLLVLSGVAPLFAGSEPSIMRASSMVGIYAFSRVIGRPTSAPNLLFLAAIIRLAAHPDELFDPGFQLTYAATAGLMLVGPALARGVRWKVLRASAIGLGAEAATTPLTLHWFHQYVIGSSVVTLVLSPVVGLMLVLAAIAASLAPHSEPFCTTALCGVRWLDALCTGVTDAVANRLRLAGFGPAPTLWILLGSYLALVVLSIAARSHRRRRFTFLILLVPIANSAWVAHTRSVVVHPRAEFLDVGQGDAILIRSGGGVILVDGGGRRNDPHFGRRVLIPLLAERGVTRLDAIALTHPDADHCVGLTDAVMLLPVREIWMSRRHVASPCGETIVKIAASRNVVVLLVDHVRLMIRRGVRFEPLVPRLALKRSPVNNSSVVYRVSLEGVDLLLTGDIEKEAETLFAEEERARLAASVLKVAHHGSASSTTAAFLDAVRPRMAVISCGRNNPFGHPAPQTLHRLRERVIPTHRTDLEGSIVVEFHDRSIRAERN